MLAELRFVLRACVIVCAYVNSVCARVFVRTCVYKLYIYLYIYVCVLCVSVYK
jgi:hypothetical protein